MRLSPQGLARWSAKRRLTVIAIWVGLFLIGGLLTSSADHAATPTKHAQARGRHGPMNATVNLDRQFERVHDHWHPRIVASVNDDEVKLDKVQGEFIWHQHQNTDELFLVIDGQLRTQLQHHGDVVLGPGELLVVPGGRHCPAADQETRVVSWSCVTRSTPAMPIGRAPSASASPDRSKTP